MVRDGGVSLENAVRMMTLTPAEIMGIQASKGSLEKGKDADIVLFDDNINVRRTIVKGKSIFVC